MADTSEIAGITELFREVAVELNRASGAERILEQLCVIAVDRVGGADWAGVSKGRRGKFQTVAATGDVVREVDAVQYELSSGPCVDAMADVHVFNAPDLAQDERWPQFGRAAADRGVCSMMSYRLFLEEQTDTIAALNLYSHATAAFDDFDETLVVLLATHGAMALSRAVETTRADNLAVALDNSREIGISIGILMATYRIPRDEAFQILRLFSQRTHRKLADIAAEVADTGSLPDVPTPRPPRPARAEPAQHPPGSPGR